MYSQIFYSIYLLVIKIGKIICVIFVPGSIYLLYLFIYLFIVPVRGTAVTII